MIKPQWKHFLPEAGPLPGGEHRRKKGHSARARVRWGKRVIITYRGYVSVAILNEPVGKALRAIDAQAAGSVLLADKALA